MNGDISVLVLYLLFVGVCGIQTASTDPSLMFQWNTVDYEWPDYSTRNDYMAESKYIPSQNGINGVRVYKGRVYVTVPRLYPGVPSTLNVLTGRADDMAPRLRPYPSWAMQTVGNCTSLQVVQGIEIDPNTGYMWILDTGYKPQRNVSVKPLDACPAKLVIYDIDRDREVDRYIFPKYVLGMGEIYLNDIVLDYRNGSAAFAYISDTLGYKLVVYDHTRKESRFFAHPTMEPELDASEITIANFSMNIPMGINGIAISRELGYVYYSAVGGVSLYRIPTDVLRSHQADIIVFSAAVRRVGKKVSQGDAMMVSNNNNLYFSTLGLNAVYKWKVSNGVEGVTSSGMKTQTVVAQDPRMEWVDTLALDDKGYLWFTSNKMHKFVTGKSDSQSPNYFIWRIYVNDYTYLNFTQATVGVGGSSVLFSCHKVVFLIVSMVSVSLQWKQ